MISYLCRSPLLGLFQFSHSTASMLLPGFFHNCLGKSNRQFLRLQQRETNRVAQISCVLGSLLYSLENSFLCILIFGIPGLRYHNSNALVLKFIKSFCIKMIKFSVNFLQVNHNTSLTIFSNLHCLNGSNLAENW